MYRELRDHASIRLMHGSVTVDKHIYRQAAREVVLHAVQARIWIFDFPFVFEKRSKPRLVEGHSFTPLCEGAESCPASMLIYDVTLPSCPFKHVLP